MSTGPFFNCQPNPHGLGRQPSLSTKIAPDKEKRELAQVHATFANRGEVKEILQAKLLYIYSSLHIIS